MKCILTLVFVCFVFVSCLAQRSPDLKAGMGMPFVFNNQEGINEHHTITTFPTLMVEKPFPLGYKREKKISLNPGLAYYFFKEDELKGTETVGYEYKLNHHTVNAFTKFLFQTKLKRRNEGFVYLGPIAGIHLFTKTLGDKTTFGLNTHEPYIEIKVNENGRDFFDLLYYGAVLGFQSNAKITNFIKPSFEVAYFPGVVARHTEREGMLQVSVLMGFHR